MIRSRPSENGRFLATVMTSPWVKLLSRTTGARDGNHAVVFRGYIANRGSIVVACGLEPGDVRRTDAELFLAAFTTWGASLQRHVTGEYCGVAVCERDGTCILTTDALGLRPLFYAELEGHLHVSSHLDTLVDAVGGGPLSDEFIADHLTMSRHFGGRTIYERIRRLEPGRPLALRTGRMIECRGWHPNDIPSVRLTSDAAYAERFRQLLDEGVARASGDRTWCELSGGLDSSAIYCSARGLGVAGLEAISIVYSRSTSADESPWMRDVIESGSPDEYARWHQLDEDVETPFSAPPHRALACPLDAALSWRLLRRYESKVIAGNADVVLSGMGGDQSLYAGGTRPLFLADDLRAGRLLRVARESSRWGRSHLMNRSARYVFVENAWRPLMNYRRGVRVTERQARHAYCPWLAPDFVSRMNLAARRTASRGARCRSVLDQYVLEDLQVVSYSMDQHWNQVVDSFEMRFPLLYRPLVEFMFGIPLEQKMRAGDDRVLQRRALVGLLPERVRTRQDKRGPDQAFFEGLLRNSHVLDLLLDRPALVERGYVDGKVWADVVRAARFAAVPRFSTFFATVTLELWFKQDEWRELSEKLGKAGTLSC